MNQALTVGLDFPRDSTNAELQPGPASGPRPVHGGVPGATGPLGRCALGYIDDCLVHSPTLEQHLLDVAEVLEIFRRRKLYAKSSKCEFGWSELGFLGHSISADGVSMHPRKVQSIMEWATPTLGAEDLRFAASRDWPTTTDDSSKGMLRSPHR